MNDSVLSVQELNYLYPGTDKGIKNINIDINKGEIVGLIGESGCGKSTLAKCISGQIRVSSGKCECAKLGYIFQDTYASLNPKKTVLWLLKEVIRFNCEGKDKDESSLIKEILDYVELDDSVLSHLPGELSGGQRQRICIAMALLSEPELLIADEPVSALDVTVQKQIVKLLKSISDKKNLAILFISHDIKVVKELCERIYILKDGEIVESGSSDELFNNPKEEYTANLLDSSYLL